MDDQKEESRRTMSEREKAFAIGGALMGAFLGYLVFGASTKDSYIPSQFILLGNICLSVAFGAILGGVSAVLLVLVFDYLFRRQ